MSVSLFDDIERAIPILFDKLQVKLEARDFVVDPEIDATESNAIQFWLNANIMESPLGERKYHHLSNLALNLLSIPATNADCESVFSLVRRIKNDFCASLSTETVSALIGCHLNTTFNAVRKENLILLF